MNIGQVFFLSPEAITWEAGNDFHPFSEQKLFCGAAFQPAWLQTLSHPPPFPAFLQLTEVCQCLETNLFQFHHLSSNACLQSFQKEIRAPRYCNLLWVQGHPTVGSSHTRIAHSLGDPTPVCPKAVDAALQEGTYLICSSMRGWRVFMFNYFGCAGVWLNTMLSPLSANLMS